MRRPVIAIAAVGAIPRDSLEALVPEIAAAFHCEVKVVPAVRLPARALDRRRGQYLPVEILDVLERARRPAWERLLGVADVDLWAEGLNFNFVFGEADPAAGVAVMSLARLAASDLAVFRRRAAVEAIHEIGHTYGLGHCRDPHCVMWFSNTLAETDRKGVRFCAAHARHLASLR